MEHGLRGRSGWLEGRTYVEIDVEVTGTTELSITDLECHGHLVAFVKFLVETFSRVRFELDVMCVYGGDQGEEEDKEGE